MSWRISRSREVSSSAGLSYWWCSRLSSRVSRSELTMISPAAAVRTAETSSSSGLVLRMKPAHPASVAATSIESSAAAVSTTT